MDLQLRQMLQNFAISQDPEDAVKFARAMIHSSERFPQVIKQPLPAQEIREQIEKTEWVEGNVEFSLSDILWHDRTFDVFLNNLSEKLIGNQNLSNIDYNLVGISPNGNMIINVAGQLDQDDYDDDEDDDMDTTDGWVEEDPAPMPDELDD